MKRNIMIILALLMMSMPVMKAQTALDIKGPITQEKMIARYGEPDSLSVRLYPGEAFERNEHYYYGDDYIYIVDGEIESYRITTDRFIHFKDIIEGGIKIGDPVAKILNSSYVRTVVEIEPPYYSYSIWLGDLDAPIKIAIDDTKTIITRIYFLEYP